jgi:hypothetical protein
MESSSRYGILLVVFAVIALGGWATYFLGWDPLNIKPDLPDWWYRTVLVTNENGKLRATPDYLPMGKEDKVRWENPSRLDFRIEFENKEYPFTEPGFASDRANEYRRPKVDTPFDEFKYSVIFGSDTLDPILKIEEEPPPGGDSAGVGS